MSGGGAEAGGGGGEVNSRSCRSLLFENSRTLHKLKLAGGLETLRGTAVSIRTGLEAEQEENRNRQEPAETGRNRRNRQESPESANIRQFSVFFS